MELNSCDVLLTFQHFHQLKLGMAMIQSKFIWHFALTLSGLLLLGAPMFAQLQSGYKLPPKAIADIVDAPPTPLLSVSPKNDVALVLERSSLPPISELAAPELRLAGIRINPRTFGRSRAPYFTKLTIKDIASGKERVISGLPPNPRIGSPRWSPDGKRVAFTLTVENGIELWTADLGDASAKRLIEPMLNDIYGASFAWLSDGKTLVAKVRPDKFMSEKRKMPDAPSVPDGPTIQENTGKALAAPTFQDLLKNAYDENLFDYFMQSRLVRVSLDGKLTPLGTAGLIASLSPSPNAKYLLVETLHRPFSYLVPAGRFPMKIDVMDMTGKVVKELADLPLAEDVGIGRDAERKGVRDAAWRADAPATLVWAEVQDGGDAKSKAEIRDKVFMLAEPFTGQPQTLISLEFRFRGMTWSEQGFALVNEFWWQSRKARTWLVKPSEKPDLIFDRSSEDRYNAPGTPVTKLASNGETVLHTVDGGKSIFLVGDGASPDGDKPFMDKFDLTVKKAERLWRSEAPYYELPVDILDDAGKVVLTSRESVSEPPNYFIRNLDKKTMTQFTSFTNPAAALSKASKELIKYKRDDGVELSATLYLPEGYDAKKDGALPMLMWAYPQEFKSAAAASQIIGSPYRFVRINWGSPLYWLTQGYAILDGPTMPIVGEGNKEPNDTYVQQLVSSAKAAVDEVVRRGVADPKRIAIGGHSYGAFMTANLLAHSDLFRAGIARSGAYNRTLTPFGFQAEERTFWQAPDTYMKMSPFMNADKINEPILLIHGEADNNTGTFPIQSERFYTALKGLGKTARLVMLPFESHGYQGRESVMHTLYEMHEWLERYVKKAETKTTAQ